MENPIYTVEREYEVQDIFAFIRVWEQRRKSVRIMRIVERVCSQLCGMTCLFLGLSGVGNMIFNKFMNATMMAMSGLFILFGIMFIFNSNSRRMAKRIWKEFLKNGTKATYVFLNDGYKGCTQSSDCTLKYSILDSVWKDKERVYLFISQNTAHIIKKSELGADVDDFLGFLAEKTGKEIQKAK